MSLTLYDDNIVIIVLTQITSENTRRQQINQTYNKTIKENNNKKRIVGFCSLNKKLKGKKVSHKSALVEVRGVSL